ncbi:hypothetical protein BDV26DRAFT_276846 [Aspergillus bertholletiae]|uniref:Uncharacterized protein n=1 Tax=Aspergillus bertholletiae TaxID=1226010 RepID=A0A5N7APX9_9EURO|nr:hypothetical protein BDV26DRAFT_276846 [Aspergillus bertholletiae]
MESNSARSFRCVRSIQNRRGSKAKVILLVGRLGAGKSSLTEIITGAEGLSSGGIHSSTDHCQVFDTNINGEESTSQNPPSTWASITTGEYQTFRNNK